jgi:hypothetical protein
MITYIKIDGRDKPKMKILEKTENFDRRPDKSGSITG